jgi:hypothetical protein
MDTMEIKGFGKHLDGIIQFKQLTEYEYLAAEMRMSVLAGDVPFEALPNSGKVRIRTMATLEKAIAKAPPGFYVDNEGKAITSFDDAVRNGIDPRLSFGHFKGKERDLLFLIWGGYLKYEAWFRNPAGEDQPETSSQ